jgi:hypothetical protein
MSDLPDERPVAGESAARRIWRVYAFFLTGSLLLSYAYAGATDPRPVLVLDVAFSVIGISGLFGFAYRKRVLHPHVWMAAAVLLPIWDALINFVLYRPQDADPASVSVSLLLLVPQYLALWRYGHSSPDVWDPPAPVASQPSSST